MESMSSSVRLFFMHGHSSTDISIQGEVIEESMDLVRKIESHGSPDGKTKVEIKITASGVVQE